MAPHLILPRLQQTSTPNTSFTPGYYSPSTHPSPIPSPIYSLPAALNPLPSAEFLPGPPTPAPPRPVTLSPTRLSVAPSPMYCDMRALRAQLRPIRPAPRTSPLFAAPPQLVIPEPRRTTVVRLPGRPLTRAALRGYTPVTNAGGSGLDLRVNWPYPDFGLFCGQAENCDK